MFHLGKANFVLGVVMMVTGILTMASVSHVLQTAPEPGSERVYDNSSGPLGHHFLAAHPWERGGTGLRTDFIPTRHAEPTGLSIQLRDLGAPEDPQLGRTAHFQVTLQCEDALIAQFVYGTTLLPGQTRWLTLATGLLLPDNPDFSPDSDCWARLYFVSGYTGYGLAARQDCAYPYRECWVYVVWGRPQEPPAPPAPGQEPPPPPPPQAHEGSPLEAAPEDVLSSSETVVTPDVHAGPSFQDLLVLLVAVVLVVMGVAVLLLALW